MIACLPARDLRVTVKVEEEERGTDHRPPSKRGRSALMHVCDAVSMRQRATAARACVGAPCLSEGAGPSAQLSPQAVVTC